MIKHIAAACLLGTALAPALAHAQDAKTPQQSAAAASGQFLTQMDAQEWRGSKLVGVDVYGSDNQKIGDINEVIIDRNGQAKAVVIGVGGFLGIGEKNVAIPWEKVQWNMGGNQSSGSMASSGASGGTRAADTGGAPAGDRSTPRDVAQTTTGSPNDPNNAQPAQSAASGGASLSSAPSSGTNANAPANSSASVSSMPTTTAASSNTSASSNASATSSASSSNQDYPDRALVSMSKQDLQNAPEFHYRSQRGGASTGSSSGGSSMTGSSGSTSGR